MLVPQYHLASGGHEPIQHEEIVVRFTCIIGGETRAVVKAGKLLPLIVNFSSPHMLIRSWDALGEICSGRLHVTRIVVLLPLRCCNARCLFDSLLRQLTDLEVGRVVQS